MRAVFALLVTFSPLFQEAEANTPSGVGDYSIFTKDGKKGLDDKFGEEVIPAIYDDLGWSDDTASPINGVIGYKKGELWGLISTSNKKIVQAMYSSLSPGLTGQIIASRKGKFSQTAFYGAINIKGSTLIPFIYYSLSKNEDVYLALSRKESKLKYGLLDGTGVVLLPFEYVTIKKMSDNLVSAEKERTFTIYNIHQRIIILDSMHNISRFDANHLLVARSQYVGLIDDNGKMVVPAKYKKIRSNKEGKFEVLAHSQWNVLDNNNQVINNLIGDGLKLFNDKIKVSSPDYEVLYSTDYVAITPSHFNNIINVVGNKVVFKKNQKYGIYDLENKSELNMKFDSLFLKDEFFYGSKQEGNRVLWSVYDTFAIKRSKFEYESISPYKNHLFAVKRLNHWGFMDRNGNEIIHCVYDSVEPIVNGQIQVTYHNNNGVIDKQGNWIVLPRKEKIQMINTEVFLSKGYTTTTLENVKGELLYFTDNPIVYKFGILIETLSDGKLRKLDVNGNIIEERMNEVSTFHDIKYVDDEYVAVKINGSYGMIDRTSGVLRITNRYQDIGRMKDGLIPVKILGKWGIVDLQEQLIVQPNYDSIFPFKNNLAVVTLNGKWGIIDKSGKQILYPEFDKLTQSKSGNFKTKKDGKYGLVDSSGRTSINTKYESLQELTNGYAIIEKNGKFGVVTSQGVNTLPQVYNEIIYDAALDRYYAKTNMSWKSLSYEQ